MAFKKAGLISKFILKGSFKLNKISKKIFKLNLILKREKPLSHKKTKSIKKPFNKNKSFLKASVLLIGALGGLSHLRASECRYWSWSSWVIMTILKVVLIPPRTTLIVFLIALKALGLTI